MLSIKPGVSLRGLRPELAAALPVVATCYAGQSWPCVVTSGTDGTHGRGSCHYTGRALDFRTRMIRDADRLEHLADQVAEALGPEFDVVLESNHLHVEFDPKGPP